MYKQGFTTPQVQQQAPQQSQQSGQPQQQNLQGYAYYAQNNQSWYQTPPQQPTPKRSSAGNGKRGSSNHNSNHNNRRPRKKRSFKWQLIKFLLLLILIAAAIIGGYVWKTQSEVKPYVNVFLDNIYVDGISLSGKSWTEGSQLVWDQINSKQNGWYVRLKNNSGEYRDITASTLGISFDPSAALSEAWAIGHNVGQNERKDIFTLKDDILLAKTTQYEFSSAQQSADTSVIDSILQSLQTSAYRAPQDATITGFSPDNIANPFSYTGEVYGQSLNTTQIREQILYMVQNLESGEILLETELLAPNVTVADLEKTVTLLYSATTPISTSSTDERTDNIRVAFSKLNGMVVQNGSSLSFNKVVGKRQVERGFYPAIEYAYGEEVWGVGGGVCQASSTLYLAAIQSGMTITKRSQHINPVSYADPSLDATVSDTKGREVDFAFRNESGSPIYITARVKGNSKRSLVCEVNIYGASLENTSYVLESVTVETLPKPSEHTLKEDKTGEHVTFTDETVKKSSGRDGLISEAYLCTYVDGVQVSRVRVSRDTYPARADVYYVGVIDRYNP